MPTTYKVAVTGGTGYIASWIIKYLLLEGHTVHTTVRVIKNVNKYRHLLDIEANSPGELKVFQADLTIKGSFNEAFSGVEYVFHTASPFLIGDQGNTMKTLIEPAVNGTKDIMEAINKLDSVKRVVLTSSVVAMYGDPIDLSDNNFRFDESFWNTSSSPSHNAYPYSKTEAEKAAWTIAESQGRWDLVTIHPAFVMGPSLTKRVDSTSINTMLRLLGGDMKLGAPEMNMVFSDVRDIAKGHLLAAFTPEAKGRYIIANESGNFLKMAECIEIYAPGKYPLPKKLIPKWLFMLVGPLLGFSRAYVKKNIGYPLSANNTKSIDELGMAYRTLATTLVDHVKQLEADGLVNKK